MDAYAFAETDAATADGILAFISVATEEELLDMGEILDRRRAEVSLPDGLLVSVLIEGSTVVSPWIISCQIDGDDEAPQADIFAVGSTPGS